LQSLLSFDCVRESTREPQFLSHARRFDTVAEGFPILDALMVESRMCSLMDDCRRNLRDPHGLVEDETGIELARPRAAVVVGPGVRKEPNPNARKVTPKSTITVGIVRSYEAKCLFHAPQSIGPLGLVDACADPQAVHFAPDRDRQLDAIYRGETAHTVGGHLKRLVEIDDPDFARA
jgi:hypothetical protein